MSHYTVLVTLPGAVSSENLEEAIGRVMAPFDENTQVEPYRSYEEDAPGSYWLTTSIRRMAEEYREGKVPEPGEFENETLPVRTARYALAAELAPTLGDNPSWPAVLEAENRLYPGAADDDDRKVYDPDKDQVYSMSTYNLLSKWDYWRIGGRWGGYFPIKNPNAIGAGELILPQPGWDSPADIPSGRCDGGRKRDLDLAGLRDQKAIKAMADWDTYHRIVDGLPPVTPWSEFLKRREAGEITIDQARELYHAQPRVVACNEAPEYKGHFLNTPVDDIEPYDREEYGLRAARSAVPGYATLDGAVDGRWYAPGEMGWFGMSNHDEDSREDYDNRVNVYVDALPEDTWMVVLDCHI